MGGRKAGCAASRTSSRCRRPCCACRSSRPVTSRSRCGIRCGDAAGGHVVGGSRAPGGRAVCAVEDPCGAGDMKAASEARQWSDRLKLNPLALLRLRWRSSRPRRLRTGGVPVGRRRRRRRSARPAAVRIPAPACTRCSGWGRSSSPAWTRSRGRRCAADRGLHRGPVHLRVVVVEAAGLYVVDPEFRGRSSTGRTRCTRRGIVWRGRRRFKRGLVGAQGAGEDREDGGRRGCELHPEGPVRCDGFDADGDPGR